MFDDASALGGRHRLSSGGALTVERRRESSGVFTTLNVGDRVSLAQSRGSLRSSNTKLGSRKVLTRFVSGARIDSTKTSAAESMEANMRASYMLIGEDVKQNL